jgi:hypothetical protein
MFNVVMTVLRKKQRIIVSLIILALLSFASVQQGAANAYLAFFEASSENGTIALEWATEWEIDTDKFIVERRTAANGTPVLIDEKDAVGNQDAGSNYSSVDENVVNGTTYWYDLFELTNSSAKALLETTSLVAGQQVQPTSTSTTTPTAGISPSPTQNSSYPGPAVTTAPPTGAANPGLQITPTAPLLGSPSATPEISMAFDLPVGPLSATATLAPLPTIQLIFPTPLARAGRDPIDSAAILYDAEGELAPPGESDARPPASRLLLIFLVLLLWVGLGAWFVYLFRRTS